MERSISPQRIATLVAGFDRHPAYLGLAESLRSAINDGRIPHDTRLPSERDLMLSLEVSRTTVTRAYSALRERGYAAARQGSGTFTRVPGGQTRSLDRVLSPRSGDDSMIDLNCAATVAAPGVAAAYESAVAELPAYLSGHGYYPAGLPELQRAVAQLYDARGLPTHPDQIMITPGSLSATAIVARAMVRSGDRVLVETPVYPNAPLSFAGAGARIVTTPVDNGGWDLETLDATLRRSAPKLGYLIPDFQNPTGHLMNDAMRATLASSLVRSRTIAVIDEAHQQLALDDQAMPAPLAAYVEAAGGEAITVGGASKVFWGGLRIGWLRAPLSLVNALTNARLTMDLGVPVMEQLVLTHLLDDPTESIDIHRERLRTQRDALAEALTNRLPDWRFKLPTGGLAMWCQLPAPLATQVVTEAELRGVIISPGPVFAPQGGMASWVRIPWTRPAADLLLAVDRLVEAWTAAVGSSEVRDTGAVTGLSGDRRIMVA
jgi:DNA-binding transcriptional MocR family regulator